MKITDILLEAYSPVDKEWILRNCENAIARYKQGHILYRGTSPRMDGPFKMVPDRTRREAAFAISNLHNDLINKSAMFKSFPKREIILTTNDRKASDYGRVYIALPVDGAKIGIIPADDIFEGFERIPNLGLFYRNVLSEFMAYMEQFDIRMGIIYDIQGARDLFKRLHAKLSDKEKKDLIDELHENDDLPGYFVNTIEKCIKTGRAIPLFKLFEPTGWKVEDISEFTAPNDVECWTDAPTILIPEDEIDSYILDKDAALESPENSYRYAKNIMNGPFPEGEEIIATDAKWAYYYARVVLKGEFPRGEEVIATDAKVASYYSGGILKGPFPKGEKAMSTDSQYAVRYIKMLTINGFEKEAQEFKEKYSL